MTDKEKAIVTAYTGYAMLAGEKLDIFYQYLAELYKRPVYSHELPQLADEIHEKSKADFIKLCKDEEIE
jgi:hypothetical protein